MTTVATITVMAGITTTVITITTTAIRKRPVHSLGDAWGGLHCWWRLRWRPRAWCKYVRVKRR
ncbi:hypothetical protein PMm318_A11660 [Pseudomonas moorei]